jgi:hypothetical protein
VKKKEEKREEDPASEGIAARESQREMFFSIKILDYWVAL